MNLGRIYVCRSFNFAGWLGISASESRLYQRKCLGRHLAIDCNYCRPFNDFQGKTTNADF